MKGIGLSLLLLLLAHADARIRCTAGTLHERGMEHVIEVGFDLGHVDTSILSSGGSSNVARLFAYSTIN